MVSQEISIFHTKKNISYPLPSVLPSPPAPLFTFMMCKDLCSAFQVLRCSNLVLRGRSELYVLTSIPGAPEMVSGLGLTRESAPEPVSDLNFGLRSLKFNNWLFYPLEKQEEWRRDVTEFKTRKMMIWEKERAQREMKVLKNLRNRNKIYKKRNIRRKQK